MLLAAFLGISNPEVAAAAIAGAVSLLVTIAAAPLRLWAEKKLQRQKVQVEYEYVQRTRLRGEIGDYQGRLHDSGVSLRYRLLNLEKNWSQGWMRRAGDYSASTSERYYFPTTIYRFMVFVGLANRFLRAAIHVDNRIAEKSDRFFVGYLKAMEWALTDVELFKTEKYEYGNDTAHFYTDHLRRMCSTALDEDGNALDLHAFERLLSGEHELERVLTFFDGIEPGLPPDPKRLDLRWDRLMVFRLLLMGFVTTIGYDYEKDDRAWFSRVAGQVQHPGVAATAAEWLPRFGLARRGDKPGQLIVASLRARATKSEGDQHTATGAE
jgi:hypothetical protein